MNPAHHTVLLLAEHNLSIGLQKQLEHYMKKIGLPTLQLRIDRGMARNMTVKRGKTKVVTDFDKRNEFETRLRQLIDVHKPRIILIQNKTVLHFISNKEHSLALCRGSVYFVNGIPCITLDGMRTATGISKLASVNHAGWLLQMDLKKAKRWYDGTQKTEPRFDYEVCDTIAKVEGLREAAISGILMAMDVETAGKGSNATLTASGYAILLARGAIKSYAIPLIDPCKDNGCHWTDEEIPYLMRLVREIHRLPIPKSMQNGSYDTHYYIKYRAPLTNWVLDTAVIFHSIWPEIPKKLEFITSVFVDHYRYWKDEGKEKDKDIDIKAGALPTTPEGWQKYLRYNAMDCHYTLLDTIALLGILCNADWVMGNYVKSMRQILGPAMAMSFRGVAIDQQMQKAYERLNEMQSFEAKQDLQLMASDKEFNPNANVQVASLLYDIYGAEPIIKKGKNAKKQARSVDEKNLKIIQTQHPILDRLISQVWKVKKPANNVSKFGTRKAVQNDAKVWRTVGLSLLNNRWCYKVNPTGTETGRYNAKSSDFWVGTGVHQVPYPMRCLMVPDPGYILWEFDYAKADMYHTAYTSQEPTMIALLQKESAGEIDTHCYHAAKFFSKPYDEIYAGYKAKEDWVVESVNGVRQNAKRIVYGANYLMGGFTLFLQMGKLAVDATAIYMGTDITGWGIKQYTAFCQNLLNFYFADMYPMLMPWLERTINQTINQGNKAICCGGRVRTFFGDPLKDKATQREMAAFFGQGGTAGMINRAMDEIYFKHGIDSHDHMMLFQVHDAIVGQSRISKLHELHLIKDAMEVENTIHGNTFVVPVDGTVGLGWGYRQTEWHKDITLDEIKTGDEKWKRKNTKLMALVG